MITSKERKWVALEMAFATIRVLLLQRKNRFEVKIK